MSELLIRMFLYVLFTLKCKKKSLTLVSKKVLAVQQLALSSIIIPMGTLTADRKIPNDASIIVPIHSVVMETI